MTATEQEATAIANEVGFDPITIATVIAALVSTISGLWQMIKNCKNPAPTPTPIDPVAAAKKHILANYHNGRYDNDLLATVIHRIRHEMQGQHKNISRPKARAAAIIMLDRARMATPKLMGAMATEAG